MVKALTISRHFNEHLVPRNEHTIKQVHGKNYLSKVAMGESICATTPYEMIPCRNATFSFNHLGYETIEEYGNTKFSALMIWALNPLDGFMGRT